MEKGRKKTPGRPKASEQKQPTHEMILQSAQTLFMEYGYQRVSIDDIAHHCGVTKATVYYYYDTKAELFTKMMEQMMEIIRRQMERMLETEDSLYDKLLRITDAQLQATYHIDTDGFVRETKASLSKDQRRAMQEGEEMLNSTLEKAFQRAMDKGEVPVVPLKFAVQAYVSLLRLGNYRDHDGVPLFPTTSECAKAIVDFFWNGMFPES